MPLVPLPDGTFFEAGGFDILPPSGHYTRGTSSPIIFPVTGRMPVDASLDGEPLLVIDGALATRGDPDWPVGWRTFEVKAEGREWTFRYGVV